MRRNQPLPEPRVDAAFLRAAGRSPVAPLRLLLSDGQALCLTRWLRVLPSKRLVGEGTWQGRHVVAKFFVAANSERHWRQEKEGLDALRAARLPTPELLLAEALPGGGHVLLTAYLEGTQSLLDACQLITPRHENQRALGDLLRPAFALLGTMHAQALLQEDLHLGNFLQSGDALFMIDGDAVRAKTQPLDATLALANLALLLAQFTPFWDPCRADWLVAYQAAGGCSLGSGELLEREVTRARATRLENFLAKTQRDCTLFSVQRRFARWSAVCRGDEDRLRACLAAPDEFMAQGTPLKEGRTSTVVKIKSPDAAGRAVKNLVLKRYNLKNLAHALGRCWRPSRAWHSWHEGHRLRFLGIATPAPLAVLEERIGSLRRRAFLLTECCDGPDLLTALSPDQAPPSELANALLSLLQQLYAARITHGDLKATNLLWYAGEVLLIDLDSVVAHTQEARFAKAWQRDRARLLRNWPEDCALFRWLDQRIPAA